MITREECLTLDNADPLRSYRQRFVLPEHLIYLDGNSLGPIARGVKERVVDAMEQGWEIDHITSWNKHQWLCCYASRHC